MDLFKKKEESEEAPKEEKRSMPSIALPKVGGLLPKPKEIPAKAKSKLKEYMRVLRITKKPSNEEYKAIVKASALGMVVIGLIGFAIHMVAQGLILYR